MSLQQLAAQHMAAQGRGPDSQLVHMSPREVVGLQALAKASGGSLTTNPQTGLPEAGFLDKMLPLLIGAGITAATGGAAAPWMVGLGIGGLETARTGSLSKGLMAGLGAYGGAGIGAGLMGAGAETLGATANAMGVPAATGAGSQAAMLAAQNQGFGQAGLEALGQSAATAPGAFTGFVQTPVQSMTSGAMGLTEAPGRSAFMNAIGGGKEALKLGAAAAAPMLMPEPPKPLDIPMSGPNPYRFRFEPGQIENPEAGYTGPVSGQRQYFDPRYIAYAGGGPVEEMSTANVYDMQNARGGVSDMGIDNSTGMQRMAHGGISHLGDYSDGGRLLRGPGDGVSDSIPAMIGSKQPARLADGEFVVPARIVSELGNGSTEAGARKLYAMLDRIQSARGKTTGKNKVAANSRADKYLPA
jgi:hypothetical protein